MPTYRLWDVYNRGWMSEPEYEARLAINGNNPDEPIEITFKEKQYGMTMRVRESKFLGVGYSVGTGSQQTIPHHMDKIPNRVLVRTATETSEEVTIGESDETNIYITVEDDIAYTWVAEV